MTTTVQVKRRYAHPADKVFDAWLTPEVAAKFLFATPTGTMIKAQIDPRVGAAFLFVDRRDGQDIEHVGEYLEIDRPRRLVFRFGVPAFSAGTTTIRVEIDPTAEGCELILTHEGVLEDYAERTVGGWTMILGALEAALG